jgi:hypothetical protein
MIAMGPTDLFPKGFIMTLKDRDRRNRDRGTGLNPKVDIHEMLLTIQNKVLGSPALNGGFDLLFQKMDVFEKQQGEVIENVKEIREAVYNPDEGIFARIKDAEIENSSKLTAVSQEIELLKLRQQHDSKNYEKETLSENDLREKLATLETDVVDIKRAYNVLKWLMMTMTGGIVLGGIKLVYGLIQTHVKFM